MKPTPLRSAPEPGSDDARSPVAEECVERVGELRVPVVDQEARPLTAVVEIHAEVPSVLEHPGAVGIACARDVFDPATPHANEHQDVRPL